MQKHLQTKSSSWQRGSCRKGTRAWWRASCAGRWLGSPGRLLPSGAPAAALHEQMCISRLLRKSCQYLHSVEGHRGDKADVGCGTLFPWGERLNLCHVLLEQQPCEGVVLSHWEPQQKPVFRTDCTSTEWFCPEPSSPLASASLCPHMCESPVSSGVQSVLKTY